jgi:hypothetical protein
VHLIAGQSVADADREIARMIETGEGQDGDFFIALVPPKGFEVSDMPGGQS